MNQMINSLKELFSSSEKVSDKDKILAQNKLNNMNIMLPSYEKNQINFTEIDHTHKQVR